MARVVIGHAPRWRTPTSCAGIAARQPVAVGLDGRQGVAAVHGWVDDAAVSVLDVLDRFEDAGVDAVVVTEITRDGTLEGPDLDGLRAALERTTMPVIASGGVGTLDDLDALAGLEVDGRRLAGVIVGQGALRGPLPGGRGHVRARLGVGRVRTARVIPCLDVTDGRVVKGVNFVGLRDAGDPVELAARYDAEGADELVFLDITASSDGRDTMVDVARRTAEEVFIPFTIGGGIRRSTTPAGCCGPGADKVSVNTSAVRAAGADRRARRASSAPSASCAPSTPGPRPTATAGRSYVHGGRTPTGSTCVAWARGGRAPRRRRDPAHVDGPRRHPRRLRPAR